MPAPVGILYGGGLAPVACLPPVGGRCDLEPEEEIEREGGKEERYSTYMGVRIVVGRQQKLCGCYGNAHWEHNANGVHFSWKRGLELT